MEKFWFVFYQSELLLKKNKDGTYTIPYGEQPPVVAKAQTTIHRVEVPTAIAWDENAREVATLCIDSPSVDTHTYEMCDLRASFHKLPRPFYLVAGKCKEILYWDMNTQFCGVCGFPMAHCTDISKRCTKCGKEVWPQLATAVIVLIERKDENGNREKDEILLVHANNFRSNYYGLVAGFVETGETLEEAVKREVHEEVGFEIKNLRYFGSQPWPYPCGLMVGFLANYASGEIKLQKSELGGGGWYTRDTLPTIPDKLSIARKLIDYWTNDL